MTYGFANQFDSNGNCQIDTEYIFSNVELPLTLFLRFNSGEEISFKIEEPPAKSCNFNPLDLFYSDNLEDFR